MKALSIFFLFLFSLHQCEAQKAVVANLKKNIVDIGYPNPLDIVVDGYKCSSFCVTTNNGIITKGENDCNYIHIPEREGISEIIIRTKNGQLISRIDFRATFIKGVPTATLCERNKGELRIYDLSKCSEISANIYGPDWNAAFLVQKYCVSITKNRDTTFAKRDILGYLFPDILKQQFKTAEPGSQLIFYGITAQGPDKRILELSPIEFTIIKE